MKNIFKKNQIIITALAIMIAIAGYLNFSGRNDVDKNNIVGDGEVLDYDTYTETQGDNILDGSTVSTEGNTELDKGGLVVDESADASDVLGETVTNDTKGTDAEDNDEYADISDEDAITDDTTQYDVSDTGEIILDTVEASADGAKTSTEGEDSTSNGEDNTTPGEAILVSTTIAPNYFANARLYREQLRSKSKETFNEIIDNNNVSEKDRTVAVTGLMNLTAITEKENATETLLEAKGFSDAVVSITDDKVDVIINAVSITEQDIAQVEEIVKRKTGAASTEIFITPVVMEE